MRIEIDEITRQYSSLYEIPLPMLRPFNESPSHIVDAVERSEDGLSLYQRFQLRVFRNPEVFVAYGFKWRENQSPTFYQYDIMHSFVEKKRVCVRGPHGLGKTALSAWLILWFSLSRDGLDWKNPVTASAWRQLTKFTMPEVHKWARNLKWDVIGREPFDERNELLTQNLKLSTGETFAVASNVPDYIEGAHAENIMYIFDEAKAIPDETFDAAEGAFSTAGSDTEDEAYALAISTPGEPVGRFYDIQCRKAGLEEWFVVHVTLAMAIKAGRISTDWAQNKKKLWGGESAIYKNRVEGEFAARDEESVIPLSWVEMAIARWHEWQEEIAQTENGEDELILEALGVDVARQGADLTVIAPKYKGYKIGKLIDFKKKSTMETVGRVKQLLDKNPNSKAIIDVLNVGAGVYDRLEELGENVEGFNAGEGTKLVDRAGTGYINKRAAAWWGLRELLDPETGENVALPPDDQLVGELTTPQYQVTSSGKYKVESKDDIKKRLNRSTDRADAVIMAFFTFVDLPMIATGKKRKRKKKAPVARKRNRRKGNR